MLKYCFDRNLFFRVFAKSLIFSPEVVYVVITGKNSEGRGGGRRKKERGKGKSEGGR